MTQKKKPDVPNVVRVLVHPVNDRALYLDVLTVLDGGVRRDPDRWEQVTGRAAVIDHWSYQTDVLSAVVFTQEPGMMYYRLSIRPGEHEVFDRLAALVIQRLSPERGESR